MERYVSYSPNTVFNGSDLFTRIANNQRETTTFPDVMRIIVKEEIMPFIVYRYSAYKIGGSHKKPSKYYRIEQSLIYINDCFIPLNKSRCDIVN